MRSLKFNSSLNLLSQIVVASTLLISTKYLYSSLGSKYFSLISISWSTITLVSLFDFGISRSATHYISRNLKHSFVKGGLLNKFTESVLLVTTALSLIISFLCSLLVFLSKYVFNIALFHHLSFGILLLLVFSIAPTILINSCRGVVEGFQDFIASNLIKLVSTSGLYLAPSLFILPFSRLFNQQELFGIAVLGIFLSRMLSVVISLGILRCSNVIPVSLRSSLNIFTFHRSAIHLRPIFSYSFWLTVTSIVGPLLLLADRYFLANDSFFVSLPYFLIPAELSARLMVIPSPYFSNMSTREISASIRTKLPKMLTLALSPSILLYIFYQPLASIWISQEFSQLSLPYAQVLILSSIFSSLGQYSYNLLHAIGNSRLPAIIHIFELLLYAVIFPLFVSWLGLLGASYATLFRSLTDFLLMTLSVYFSVYPTFTRS